eukprot:maker-scaffold84_size396325-snap-gene-0.20 protein:Tk09675 transcript:maker-scaffold84_size396325-snap-gene-0.20-mRNA-1 annotation:"xaa-pro aminopeptidase"
MTVTMIGDQPPMNPRSRGFHHTLVSASNFGKRPPGKRRRRKERSKAQEPHFSARNTSRPVRNPSSFFCGRAAVRPRNRWTPCTLLYVILLWCHLFWLPSMAQHTLQPNVEAKTQSDSERTVIFGSQLNLTKIKFDHSKWIPMDKTLENPLEGGIVDPAPSSEANSTLASVGQLNSTVGDLSVASSTLKHAPQEVTSKDLPLITATSELPPLMIKNTNDDDLAIDLEITTATFE